jgi:hypothetical protein
MYDHKFLVSLHDFWYEGPEFLYIVYRPINYNNESLELNQSKLYSNETNGKKYIVGLLRPLSSDFITQHVCMAMDEHFQWLTHRSPPSEANVHSHSSGQNLRRLLWNPRLITPCTRASHWIPSWGRWNQSTPLYYIPLRSVLILYSHLRRVSQIVWSLEVFQLNMCMNFSFPPRVLLPSNVSTSFCCICNPIMNK